MGSAVLVRSPQVSIKRGFADLIAEIVGILPYKGSELGVVEIAGFPFSRYHYLNQNIF